MILDNRLNVDKLYFEVFEVQNWTTKLVLAEAVKRSNMDFRFQGSLME